MPRVATRRALAAASKLYDEGRREAYLDGLEWNQTSDTWTALYDEDFDVREGVQWDTFHDEWAGL